MNRAYASAVTSKATPAIYRSRHELPRDAGSQLRLAGSQPVGTRAPDWGDSGSTGAEEAIGCAATCLQLCHAVR